jgi:hypothetical protein
MFCVEDKILFISAMKIRRSLGRWKLKIKNEKLKSQNGSCVRRTDLLTPSAGKKT